MGFEIFALDVERGVLALSPVPGGGGDLAADVAAIDAWGGTLVISATEQEEMATLGAGDLPDVLRGAGVVWVHFPIQDFGVPERAVEARWVEVSKLAHQHLETGGHVLVHCRGGCGRSGMLVLRLMVEAGRAPEEALAQLRRVRACAVETDAQMDWATGGNQL
ncbi:protein-tyrosine phosphatase family protein [uncultured Shimia sp.]|uniref:protein-tyrosine phosphatase family protein n=1 Tax=uncultured Shimia sp. TaxID=573152 RepID=UPI0025D76A81|nr:protein-tyrosine phosphatase family protein [uncultured Shimia sp.]